MILSTFHPSVSAAPEIKIRYPISHLEDEETIPRRTTITSFNHHILSQDVQNKILDFFETLIFNEECIKKVRESLLNDKDFDPLFLFQYLTNGNAASTNSLSISALASFV